MSAKKNLPLFAMASAGDLSTNFTSKPTMISTVDRVMLVINVTGTPTGVLSVQASIDYAPATSSKPNTGTWFNMPLSLTALAGAAQDYVIDMAATSINALRLNYVSTSGAGNITANIFGKES